MRNRDCATTRSFDVVVIGAGPAGLMAAIAAAEGGARVALCEQLEQPGRKLLTTGGGTADAVGGRRRHPLADGDRAERVGGGVVGEGTGDLRGHFEHFDRHV